MFTNGTSKQKICTISFLGRGARRFRNCILLYIQLKIGFWYGGRHPGEIWSYSNYLQPSGSDRSGRSGLGAHLRQRVLGAVSTLLSVLELVGELFVLLQVDVGDFFLKTHHSSIFSLVHSYRLLDLLLLDLEFVLEFVDQVLQTFEVLLVLVDLQSSHL